MGSYYLIDSIKCWWSNNAVIHARFVFLGKWGVVVVQYVFSRPELYKFAWRVWYMCQLSKMIPKLEYFPKFVLTRLIALHEKYAYKLIITVYLSMLNMI